MAEYDSKVAAEDFLLSARQYQEREDAMYKSRPKYEDVASQVQAKALKLMREKGVDPSVAPRVIPLVREELDAFWGAGGLTAVGAYEHGYAARAIVEEALRRQGASFDLLEIYKEVLTATNPTHFADYSSNDYAVGLLWDVLQKQKLLIEKGVRPVDNLSFYTIYDWCRMTTRKARSTQTAQEGWKWLVDHADEGGWGCIRDWLQKALDLSRKGTAYAFNPYVYRERVRVPDEESFISARRLTSFQGTTFTARKAKLALWDAAKEHVNLPLE